MWVFNEVWRELNGCYFMLQQIFYVSLHYHLIILFSDADIFLNYLKSLIITFYELVLLNIRIPFLLYVDV